MDERAKMAFELAREIATQLITLSTGFLALTITFTKELITRVPEGSRALLMASWGFHVLSIVFGVWTLMGLTGTVSPVAVTDLPADWSKWTFDSNVRFPAACQIATFTIGTVTMAGYAISALRPSAVPPKTK